MSLQATATHLSSASPTARPIHLAWALTGAIAAIDLLGMIVLGFSVPFPRALMLMTVGGGMIALASFYTHNRPEPRIAAGASAAGFLVLFTMLLATASYLGMGLARPLWDTHLAALDFALSFDWTTHLAYVVERPWLAFGLEIAYHTSLPQVAIVILGLSARGLTFRLEQFLLLFALTATTVIAISSLAPAIGAYEWHKPPRALIEALRDPEAGRWHLEHLNGLRDGGMRMIPLDKLEGLVSFPSFHTALAIITLWALKPIRWLAAPAYLLNGALILATLSIGGHYLADLIGGALIAVAAIAYVSREPGKIISGKTALGQASFTR